MDLAQYVGVSIPVFFFLFTILAYHKERKRLENLVSRLQSLALGSSSRLRRLARFSHFNLWSNVQIIRELDREITTSERNNNIYTSYRLRRTDLLPGQIMDSMEKRIGHLEKALAT